MKWKFNIDDVDYWMGDDYDTKEEAIKAGIEELKELQKYDERYKEVDKIYVGQIKYYVPYINPEMIIEQAANIAYDECGESAEDWLYYVKEEDRRKLEERINEVFIEWLKEVNEMPTFGTMVNIEEVNVKDVK